MKSIVFSPAAEGDMAEIWVHSAENWGPDQADRYIDEIRDLCFSLASGQLSGRAVDVRTGYLKYPVGSHMVYFQTPGDRLEVVRILHQRRDVERHL